MNPNLDEMSRGDLVIKLEPRMARLLGRLAGNPGEVVSTQQLLDSVWPDVVVGPASVYQAISHLRKLLGDTGSTPTYIATVPRKGYRLVAHLKAPDPPGAVPQSVTARKRRANTWGWILGSSLLLGAVVGSRYFPSAETPRPSAAREHPRPAGLPELDRHTLVVLPFTASSGREEDVSAAGVVTDALRNRLASSSTYTVIGRYSSRLAVKMESDRTNIAARLNSRYLIEGNAARAAEQIIVEARLSDQVSGDEIWSTRLQRPVSEIALVNEEIAKTLSDRMGLGIREIKVVFPIDVDVYSIYLRGLEFLDKETLEDNAMAQALFARSVTLDPVFARGHLGVGLAGVQESRLRRFWANKVFSASYRALERALRLDPGLGEAWTGKALYLYYKPPEAEAAHKRALELAPNDSHSFLAFSDFLTQNQRLQEAKEMLDRAHRIDPLSAREMVKMSYLANMVMGDGAEQEQLLRRALEIDPELPVAMYELGRIKHDLHGEFAEGVRLAERALAKDPGSDIAKFYLTSMYLDLGEPNAAASLGTQMTVLSAVQIALYRGDYAEAASRANSNAQPIFWVVGSPSLCQALLEDAMRKNRVPEFLQFLDAEIATSKDVPFLRVSSFLEYKARALLFLGRKDEARHIAGEILGSLDARNMDHPITYDFRGYRAEPYMLLGEHEKALQELEFRLGRNRYGGWWYYGERDLLFEPLRKLPRFRALQARVNQHREEQRRLLEEMRRRGEVPRRPIS
ncbi:MAG TPA: winged helix-turn-helix domain-containing protein [Steroidobacteraceae bacterium]|nr:winged helix-turn-helix domain-containing protein [Steroidobacteraceae bacterium]